MCVTWCCKEQPASLLPALVTASHGCCPRDGCCLVLVSGQAMPSAVMQAHPHSEPTVDDSAARQQMTAQGEEHWTALALRLCLHA